MISASALRRAAPRSAVLFWSVRDARQTDGLQELVPSIPSSSLPLRSLKEYRLDVVYPSDGGRIPADKYRQIDELRTRSYAQRSSPATLQYDPWDQASAFFCIYDGDLLIHVMRMTFPSMLPHLFHVWTGGVWNPGQLALAQTRGATLFIPGTEVDYRCQNLLATAIGVSVSFAVRCGYRENTSLVVVVDRDYEPKLEANFQRLGYRFLSAAELPREIDGRPTPVTSDAKSAIIECHCGFPETLPIRPMEMPLPCFGIREYRSTLERKQAAKNVRVTVNEESFEAAASYFFRDRSSIVAGRSLRRVKTA